MKICSWVFLQCYLQTQIPSQKIEKKPYILGVKINIPQTPFKNQDSLASSWEYLSLGAPMRPLSTNEINSEQDTLPSLATSPQ